MISSDCQVAAKWTWLLILVSCCSQSCDALSQQGNLLNLLCNGIRSGSRFKQVALRRWQLPDSAAQQGVSGEERRNVVRMYARWTCDIHVFLSPATGVPFDRLQQFKGWVGWGKVESEASPEGGKQKSISSMDLDCDVCYLIWCGRAGRLLSRLTVWLKPDRTGSPTFPFIYGSNRLGCGTEKKRRTRKNTSHAGLGFPNCCDHFQFWREEPNSSLPPPPSVPLTFHWSITAQNMTASRTESFASTTPFSRCLSQGQPSLFKRMASGQIDEINTLIRCISEKKLRDDYVDEWGEIICVGLGIWNVPIGCSVDPYITLMIVIRSRESWSPTENYRSCAE